MWFDNAIAEADTSEEQLGNSNYMSLPGWKPLERCAVLCNRAEFKPGEGNKPVVRREANGDASETALLKCTELSTGDVMGFRAKYRKICEIPFNSRNKFQVSIHENSKGNSVY